MKEKKYYLSPTKPVAPKFLGFLAAGFYILVAVTAVFLVIALVCGNFRTALIDGGIIVALLVAILALRFIFAWDRGYVVKVGNSHVDTEIRTMEILQGTGVGDTKQFVRNVTNIEVEKSRIILTGEVYVDTGFKKKGTGRVYKNSKAIIYGNSKDREELIEKLREVYGK